MIRQPINCNSGWASGLTRRTACHLIAEWLTAAGCDDADYDARCLVVWVTDQPFSALPATGDRPLSPSQAQRLEQAVAQRIAHRPLQYIVGTWDFLNLTLEVGEGVLIPRADTEILCETVVDFLNTVACPKPTVYDLCAGSGCVGLGIASLTHGAAEVTAVEWSEEALAYLRRNCARYPQLSVTPLHADVLQDAARLADDVSVIVSNPPYIPTQDLPSLMAEVQQEPRMALDGGDGDGLRFYRAIAEQWVPKLRRGGLCAVEVGQGQAAAVAALWRQAGLLSVDIRCDYAGIERVVSGIRAV